MGRLTRRLVLKMAGAEGDAGERRDVLPGVRAPDKLALRMGGRALEGERYRLDERAGYGGRTRGKRVPLSAYTMIAVCRLGRYLFRHRHKLRSNGEVLEKR